MEPVFGRLVSGTPEKVDVGFVEGEDDLSAPEKVIGLSWGTGNQTPYTSVLLGGPGMEVVDMKKARRSARTKEVGCCRNSQRVYAAAPSVQIRIARQSEAVVLRYGVWYLFSPRSRLEHIRILTVTLLYIT